MRCDISTVTLFICPVSCTSGQLKTLPPPLSAPLCLPFLPVICILTAPPSCSLFSYFTTSVTYLLYFIPSFVYLSSSFCSTCPAALRAPLLFVLVINCCLQAENEVLVCVVAGVCVFFVFICTYCYCRGQPPKVHILY